MNRLGILTLMLILCATLLTPHVSLAAGSGAERFSAVISPEMELLAGVLSQSEWMKTQGPRGEGNEYFRALQSFFAPYKNHEAVRLANDFSRTGFVYDAPPAFMCHLGPLPELDLRYEYSDYLVGRAKDRERLEAFRVALRDLAAESNFLEFIAEWQPKFDQWASNRTLDGDRVVGWLEDFFGKRASEFHLVLAPAMFPGGGYGAIINLPDGEMISYQIIRESGSNMTPAFPTGRDLEYLSLHEWGHSFVNPAVERHSQQVQGLNYLFTPIRRAMENQAYTSVHVFMNEQVLRGVTALATLDFYGEAAFREIIAYEKARSFYLTDEVVEILEVYRSNRDTFPTFNDFVPEFLTRLGESKVRIPFWQRDDFKRLFLSAFLTSLVTLAVVRIRRRFKTSD